MKIGARNRSNPEAMEKVGQRHRGVRMGGRYHPVKTAGGGMMKRMRGLTE
jgi:hypothetical protein